MELITEKAENYARQYTSPLEELLQANETQTMATHEHAQMHSGHLQGKVLEALSRMIRPKKILEIGTFTGFSALCLAKGLKPNGVLHTIELRDEDGEYARACFNKSEHAGRIKLHIGNALDIIPGLQEEWDMVFIDADKVNYIAYYELTLSALKPGGWIIADNVLFHGQVLEEEIRGKNAVAIHAFNQHVAADTRVEQVLLTVRDGLMLIRKI